MRSGPSDGERAGLDLSIEGIDVRWAGALEPNDVTTVKGLRLERVASAGQVGASRAEWCESAARFGEDILAKLQ